MSTIFPLTPVVDDIFEKWQWDGTVWKLIGTFDTGNALHIHNEDTTNVHGIPDTQAAFSLQTYSPTEPTSPNIGDIWVDSDSFVPSVDTAVLFRWRKTATGGETSLSGNDDNSLSLNYTPNYESVFLNGILLVRGVDYIATTGTTITDLLALTANDIVEVMSPNAMSLADVYTQEQVNTNFAPLSSPTFTGTATIPTATISAMTSGAGYIGEVISSRSTTTQTGSLSSNLVGNSSITLSPGTWLVQSLATAIMASGSAADGVSCGIYNSTASTEVTASRGMSGYSTTTQSNGVVSMLTKIVVTSNTVYAPLICRNGVSTVATNASAGAAANAITALRIG
jgi:hypothetical protein